MASSDHTVLCLLLRVCLPVLLALSLTGHSATKNLHFHHISPDQGFALHTVTAITQDSQGYIWLGSQDGAYRYDGYTFTVYRHNPNNPYSLPTDHISATLTDTRGNFWIGGFGSSISRFDPATDRFINYPLKPGTDISSLEYRILTLQEDNDGLIWIGTINGLFSLEVDKNRIHHYHYRREGDLTNLSNNVVTAIYHDSDGHFWVGTQFNGLNRLDTTTGLFETIPIESTLNNRVDTLHITAIVEDNNGVLWLGTQTGLIAYDKESGKSIHYTYTSENPQSLSNNHINHLLIDSLNQIWIATAEGLNIFDPETKQFISYYKDSLDPESLSSDNVMYLFEDNANSIWIATKTGGLNRFDNISAHFEHIKPLRKGTDGLSGLYVYAVYEDKNNMLWFGSSDGGITRYDPVNKQFKRFTHDPDDPLSLSSRDIRDITETVDGTLWIATNTAGICRFDPETQTFERYQHDPKNKHSLSHNSVIALQADPGGDLWVGTRSGGLNRFNPKTKTFRHYRHDPSNPHSLSSDTIWSLAVDHDDVLWVGTADAGLNRFERSTESFVHYQHDDNDPDSIATGSIIVLFVDSENRLWLSGQNYGMDMYDKENKRFIHYTTSNGMSNNTVYAILEESNNVYWISSNSGLSRFDAVKKQFEHYNVQDGLQADEFNAKAAHKTRDGKLYFGGVYGINAFYPEKIRRAAEFSPTVITEFRVFDKLIKPGGEPADNMARTHIFNLEKTINFTEFMTLTHEENLFSFDFASLQFINPKKILYRYKLEGWDEQWIHTDAGIRRATYTNIPAGRYTFKVMASNSIGEWRTDLTREIAIRILPPPWKSGWAYLGYLFFLIAMITIVWQWVSEKNKARHKQIALEKSMEYSSKLKQLDKLKDEFLANTSHELRTPLNGIIGLSELMMNGLGRPPTDNEKEYLQLIIHSGKRLAHLVNDILDYSKLKSKSLDLQMSNVNLHAITEMVLAISRPMVGSKQVQLLNLVDPELPPVRADENRLQQILHNLVGNAVKFTDSGYVEVLAQLYQQYVIIKVKDSGIGIKKEKQQKIFEYFEQADSGTTKSYSGTGMGLAITKKLVQLHGCELELESEEGVGSTFSFQLPIVFEATHDQPLHANAHACRKKFHFLSPKNTVTDNTLVENQVSTQQPGKDTVILVVDDNVVNRKVIMSYLKLENYLTIEAVDGCAALDIFNAGQKIDLVLLDIMMPTVSGFEVCKAIREVYLREELPVIFLTASSNKSDLIQSFAVGGNDFLNKPVDRGELLSHIKIHLSLTRKYQQQTSASMDMKEHDMPQCHQSD